MHKHRLYEARQREQDHTACLTSGGWVEQQGNEALQMEVGSLDVFTS